jgi:zinc transporter ZupT
MRNALATVTAASTGLLAGAMVFIEAVLVPFWRGSSPREFREWFAVHSPRIRALMVPLGAGAAAAATATAIAEGVSEDGVRSASAAAAASAASVVAITVSVNEPANEKFAQVDFDDEETTRLLQRWARWHHARVGLGLVAAVAAALTARGAR